jgi:hypothetical protein
MSRPRKGQQVRKSVSIRLEPADKEMLAKQFGTIQKAVDHLIEKVKANEKMQ